MGTRDDEYDYLFKGKTKLLFFFSRYRDSPLLLAVWLNRPADELSGYAKLAAINLCALFHRAYGKKCQQDYLLYVTQNDLSLRL